MNSIDIEEQLQRGIAEWKEKKAAIDYDSLQDEDGYPTDYALDLIEEWHWIDTKEFFAFIKELWAYNIWKEKDILVDDYNNFEYSSPRHRYYISTAGWSGNESIIRAMQENRMMWGLNWVQSRRGGHYIFELHEFPDERENTDANNNT